MGMAKWILKVRIKYSFLTVVLFNTSLDRYRENIGIHTQFCILGDNFGGKFLFARGALGKFSCYLARKLNPTFCSLSMKMLSQIIQILR